MWLKWLPWRTIVRRVARARGFIDPIALLSHLHRFAQPSEVAAPLELLRAGVVFHARGLMNTGAIQHNLDWVWPHWVERQFDPHDVAFIPRAFSITHVNLTHRNWTAVGLPDLDWFPLVDPRGLVTPFWDSWSIDFWIVDDQGERRLLPSRLNQVRQTVDMDSGLAVVTKAELPEPSPNQARRSEKSRGDAQSITSRVEVINDHGVPVLKNTVTALSAHDAWLVVSLRPANPEGVSFLHRIALDDAGQQWTVDGDRQVRFHEPVDRHALATYRDGDVLTRLPTPTMDSSVTCDVGMATAAAMFRLQAGQQRTVIVDVPRVHLTESSHHTATEAWQNTDWPAALGEHCQIQLPDERLQELFDIAVRTLVLHSPGDVYPGPYTYKRFWFRDAAFILQAMLHLGMVSRVEAVLDRFPERQTRAGYFLSQEGEWDSNGAALWIVDLYCRLTGKPLDDSWRRSIERGARWIVRKRLSDNLDSVHAGLLPAGFSAEHLGPNDFYYWDDYWSVAGLRSAAARFSAWGDEAKATEMHAEADKLVRAIERSLVASADRRQHPGIPASPHRRMDAGAIGSIVCGYPLQLLPPDDRRLLATAEFLQEHAFVDGGFFQDMIHSGLNPYLTLHVAQIMLRAGDLRFEGMLDTVARIASPTGQWPEAVHPRTLGGCMGDGQHVWAAAEWIMLLRNCFVREEGNRLVLGSGILPRWIDSGQPLALGPTLTPFGPIAVRIEPVLREDPSGDGASDLAEDSRRDTAAVQVSWQAKWRSGEPNIEIALPGWDPVTATRGQSRIVLERAVAR